MSDVGVFTEVIAKITATFLGVEDHGILTATLSLDYGGSGQSAGGYALDGYCATCKTRHGTAWGMEHVARILAACGVTKWEDVKGRTVLALMDGGKVAGIAPLPTERGERVIFAGMPVCPSDVLA